MKEEQLNIEINHTFSFNITLLDNEDFLLIYREQNNQNNTNFLKNIDALILYEKKYSIRNNFNNDLIGLIGKSKEQKEIFLFNPTFSELYFESIIDIINN